MLMLILVVVVIGFSRVILYDLADEHSKSTFFFNISVTVSIEIRHLKRWDFNNVYYTAIQPVALFCDSKLIS